MGLSALMVVCLVKAQDPVAQKYGAKITASDLKEYLSIIASDAMEGRETGKRGQKMAAAFIASHFEEIGLEAKAPEGYFQPVYLYKQVLGAATVKTASGATYKNYQDIVYSGSMDSKGEVTLPIVYVGFGRDEDYASLDVAGKAVLIRSENQKLYEIKLRAFDKGAKVIFVWNTNSQDDFEKASAKAKKNEYDDGLSLSKTRSPSTYVGDFEVSGTVAAALMQTSTEKLMDAASDNLRKKSLKKIPTSTVTYKVSMEMKTVKTENVLGYLEGTDKKNELVIVTAHYDHIGKKDSGTGDLISNGADDDGSGTVSVMELAKQFAQAKEDGHGPRRSMLFMTFTGEEKGLLGSEYYTEHPVFKLENTVVDLNIDMVGRRDAKHQTDANYVYVIGADKLSLDLNKLSERVNNTYTKLNFDYVYNDEHHPDRLYYRSDHWNFAKNNVPIIFYFDGIHEDYHRVTDEVDKIEFDLLAKRAQLVFYTAWEIANREGRLILNTKK